MRNIRTSLLSVVSIMLAVLTMAFSGGGSGKMTICHIPPGNPENAHTITISANAWPAHEAHGDKDTACENVPTRTPDPTSVPTEVPTRTPDPTAVPTEHPTRTPDPVDPTPVPSRTPDPTSVPTEVPTRTVDPTEVVVVVDPDPTSVPDPVVEDVKCPVCCPEVSVVVEDSPLFTDSQLGLVLLTALALGLMNLLARRK